MEMLSNKTPHASCPHPDGRSAYARAGGDGTPNVRWSSIHGAPGSAPSDGPSTSHGFRFSYPYSGGDAGTSCWSPQPLPPEGSAVAANPIWGTLAPPGEDDVDCGLIRRFCGMHLAGNEGVRIRIPSTQESLFMSNPIGSSRFQTNYAHDLLMDCRINDAVRVARSSALPESVLFDSGNRSHISGFQQRCAKDANLCGHHPMPSSFLHGEEALDANGLFGRPSFTTGGRVLHSQPSVKLPSPMSSAFSSSQRIETEHDWDFSSVHRIGTRHVWCLDGDHVGAVPNGFPASLRDSWDHQLALPTDQNKIEVFSCEDSLIIQGKGPTYVRNRNQAHDKHADKRLQSNAKCGLERRQYKNLEMLQNFTTPRLSRSIHSMAKDQNGLQLLQQKIDEGKHQVDVIFNEVIDHLEELMVHLFGNYLIQKLLEHCDEEQLMKIVLVLIEDLYMLVNISCDIYGTRTMQKLVETLEDRQAIALLVATMQPVFLKLSKDPNGSYVVQGCLKSFGADDNKLIFDAAAIHCVELATHHRGCSVLKQCLISSTGRSRERLVFEVCAHGVQLAQDKSGNYIVQSVLALQSSEAAALLASQFKGMYVELAKQQCSSNVVEKCLMTFAEEYRAGIIYELLSAPELILLLQDPFANYVIQTAINTSNGILRNALLEAIRPYAKDLRTHPHCKKIFSLLSNNPRYIKCRQSVKW